METMANTVGSNGFVLPVRGTDGIFRFPRRNAEDVARFRTAWLIAALEKRALNWIGRGLKANIKLGRIFIRLKQLVGHGNFRAYYERTFGKYGVSFRRAEEYMALARKAGKDTNCADSALFPLAMDPQAAEIRAATRAHQLAVAAAQSGSTAEAAGADEDHSGHSEESSDSTCICRPSLNVTPDQKAKITELWRSKHRATAETQVIDLLMELCDRYDGGGDDGSDSGSGSASGSSSSEDPNKVLKEMEKSIEQNCGSGSGSDSEDDDE